MQRCAFLTMENLEGFYAYDELACEPMSMHGWQVEEIPWTTPDVAWDDYQLVVIRSTWDYQSDFGRFLRVLKEIDRSRARLENSLEVVCWNIEKTYLKDLADRGVPIVPTRWLNRLDRNLLQELFDELQAEQLVVKPVIGANADDTFRLSVDDAQTQTAIDTFRDRGLMVQPFVDSIKSPGEFSLFYFADEYSHCVLKTPKSGDFRVQEEHGGAIRSFVADEEMRSVGQLVIQAVEFDLLYARVDLVRTADGLAVMELELIEPSLYFPYDSASPQRFADAVARRCS